MQRQVSMGLPRPRMFVHPGRFSPVRINSQSCRQARHVRLQLQAGSSLFSSLVEPLAAIGITHASTTILGGLFDTLTYCVAPPDPSGQAVIAYGQPIDAGKSLIVFGNATIGLSLSRKPLVHCHAVIRTECGDIRGGHILTETCMVSQPISVLVTSFEGFELRQAHDPETNIPLLQPFPELPDV